MAGTRKGGLMAAMTNKLRYDDKYKAEGGFYGHIGRKGGSAKTDKPKGMAAATPEQRAAWGRRGGEATRRRK